MTLSHRFLYLTALAIPFPALGIALTERLPLSPAIIFGTVYSVIVLVTRGIGRPHIAAGCMLSIFVLTAIPRHAPTTYLLSIGALGLAIAPLTAPVLTRLAWQKLLNGFALGLYLTLAIICVEVGAQLFDIGSISETLKLIFPYGNQGASLSLVRAKAGFLEPSHLAIYLCFAFAVLDFSKSFERSLTWHKWAVLLALLSIGSLSGIAIIAIYLAAKNIDDLPKRAQGGFTRRQVFYAIIGLTLSIAAFSYFADTVVQATQVYAHRLDKALLAIREGGLEGSEGSRVNSFLALPRYWSESGFPGFLFGTGYANYEDWLISTYGYLGSFSTFARGQIDNMLVAIFLSTGVFGMAAYLVFTWSVFRGIRIRRGIWIAIFIATVNFAYGYLVLYLYWYLIFVLRAALRFQQQVALSPGRMSARVIRRPSSQQRFGKRAVPSPF